MQQKAALIGGVVGIAILGGLFFFFGHTHTEEAQLVATTTPQTVSDPSLLPGIQTGLAPWSVELAHLQERLSADSLPALSQEGTVLHIHQHLDLFINGDPVSVPAGIGINEDAGFISPIHVHDTTGIIHVESPYQASFTLGEFFDIWGVRFSNTCIGGYCADESHSLRIYVNGELYQGDPREIVLASHQEIAIVYGTSAQIPKTIPATYTFPQGY
jgi:hypothetical protein